MGQYWKKMFEPKFVIKTLTGFLLAINSITIFTHGGAFEFMIAGLVLGIPFLIWAFSEEKSLVIRGIVIAYLILGSLTLSGQLNYQTIALRWNTDVEEVLSMKYLILMSIQTGLSSLAIVLLPFKFGLNRNKMALPNKN